MAKGIAKAMTNFAGDVWKGMSKGASAGKVFTVNGVKTSTGAMSRVKNINRVNNLKKMNVKNSMPKISKTKSIGQASIGQKAGNFVGGGIRDTYINMNKNNMNFKDAIRSAHTRKDGPGLSKTKMAGTFVGVSAAGRIATGGGVMKDKNGNTNVIGIPFI